MASIDESASSDSAAEFMELPEQRARKEKILDLVTEIRSAKTRSKYGKGKKKKTATCTSTKSVEETSSNMVGRGKHSIYKLNIGWQHFTNGKYRVVTMRKGGGIRQTQYKTDEYMAVDDVINRGKQFFFPNGRSKMGDLQDMDVTLATFDSDDITSFTDLDGNDCSLQDYLKSRGLFSSQYHLYIRTKLRQKPALVLLVNNRIPGEIKITYSKVTASSYEPSSSESYITARSMRNCFALSAHHETPYEDYNCVVDDGFLITYVEKEGKVFLTKLEDGSYQVNSFVENQNLSVIIHGPDDVYGMNDGDLMIGLISQLHNQDVIYRWFWNGDQVCEGVNMSMIKVTSPGNYSVGIVFNEELYMCGVECAVTEQQQQSQPLEVHAKQASQHSQIHKEQTFQSLNLTEQVSQPSLLHTEMMSQPSLHTEQMSQPSRALLHTEQMSQPSPLHTEQVSQPLLLQTEQVSQPSQLHTEQVSQPSLLHTEQVSQPSLLHTEQVSQPFLLQTEQMSQPSLLHTEQMSQPSPLHTEQVSQPSLLHTEQVSQPSLLHTEQVSQPSLLHTEQMSQPSPLHNEQVLQPSLLHTEQMSQPSPLHTEQVLQPSLLHTEQMSQPSPLHTEQVSHSSLLHTEQKSLEQSYAKLSTGLTSMSDSGSCAFYELGCNCLPKIQLNDISFHEEIGRGAFGVVRKAKWLGTDVAVKEVVVKRMKLAKPYIKQELNIHSKVRHPNIIPIMGYAIEKNKVLMITELNKGSNLDDIIFDDDSGEKLSYEKKIDVARNIVQAVAYLHNQSPVIIHRDIKPENVLISTDFDRIRLCDLGISKLKTMNTMVTTSDSASMQPGTPAYQAPEVLLEQKSGSTCSDVWSLGCTLLELFTGVPVWNIPPEVHPVTYIVSCMKEGKQPDSLQLFVSMFSDESLFKLLNSALSYDIKKRQTSLEMLRSLELLMS